MYQHRGLALKVPACLTQWLTEQVFLIAIHCIYIWSELISLSVHQLRSTEFSFLLYCGSLIFQRSVEK